MEVKTLQKPTNKYSHKKASTNTVINSIPVIVIVLSNYLNKKLNLEMDDVTINAVVTLLSLGFYYIKNWLKNRKIGY